MIASNVTRSFYPIWPRNGTPETSYTVYNDVRGYSSEDRAYLEEGRRVGDGSDPGGDTSGVALGTGLEGIGRL
jgi:hypothetical protein